jgi:hypothetical protein
MKNKDKVIKYGLLILLGLGLIAYIPQVREWIVDLVEYIKQRNVRNHQIAMYNLSNWLKIYICTILFTGLILKEKNRIKVCLSDINFKVFLTPVLLMTGIYLLGIISILRADFLYIDDIHRAIGEDYARNNFSWGRYLADILSKLVHTTPMIADLSPLTQILAITILSVSSVLFVYVLCDRKIKTIALLASIPLGLSPYILENLSYKFDAPYMMLSILFSIIPFLFVESRRCFVVISIISLMLMCLTYQASSGIYLLITLYLCYHQWNNNKKTLKQTGVFFLTSAVSYVCALMAYRLLFVDKYKHTYTGTEAFEPSQLIPGVIQNISRYFTYIHSDFATLWQVLIVFILICFIVQSVRNSKRNKWISVILSCFIVLITAILSYGPYLILENPLFHPRALYGFGFFIAMFCIGSVSGGNKFPIVCVLALSWCFLVFATIYGNALADQKRYVNFRIEALANDMGRLFPNRSQKEMKIQFENKIGHSAVVESIAEYYPVIKRLVPYRNQSEFDYVICSQLFGYHNLWKYKKTIDEFSKDNLPVLYDCYYHSIYGDDECVLIIFKNE